MDSSVRSVRINGWVNSNQISEINEFKLEFFLLLAGTMSQTLKGETGDGRKPLSVKEIIEATVVWRKVQEIGVKDQEASIRRESMVRNILNGREVGVAGKVKVAVEKDLEVDPEAVLKSPVTKSLPGKSDLAQKVPNGNIVVKVGLAVSLDEKKPNIGIIQRNPRSLERRASPKVLGKSFLKIF
jgi:hypothetical protein